MGLTERLPSKIENVERQGNDVKLSLKPVAIKFKDGFEIKIKTEYDFLSDGKIGISRKILTDNLKDVEFTEYVKGCYGFTEYPEDMKGICFNIDGIKAGEYKYNAKTYGITSCRSISLVIPKINTEVELKPVGDAEGIISDGHHFAPYYTLKLKYKLKGNEREVKSWLNIKKLKV